ncbi:hypothetical protein [Rhizobacter sp. SG703]|uniref:tetratricopeptide repeat protein n=1 Tax=Rhizobacter sp. SG703 TaxID=2587140 RepID=UPI001447539D|nr:hypothetical protein [Rhizobacter sp. SG703]NKI92556.1 hypothetical protein [Rhizobacter sp. SG703]
MRLRNVPATLLRVAAAACLVGALPGTAQAAEPLPPHLVQDPYYGETLFQFYQGRYFSSITGLMVSQHFGRVSHHTDEAEILRGGLLLSYGLHREAGEIFAQLIEKGAPPSVRDRAWFYLAKIRYQRGFLPEAEEALGRIEKNLPPEFEEERGLLSANVLMARDDFAGAAAQLEALARLPDPGKMPGGANATRYARFNLGVALIRTGDAERGNQLLDQLGQAPAPDEETRSLRDKANVALGFAALQDNKPEAATIYLERVRLNGMQANKALLGFGWAQAALKQPKRALVPWQELAQRDPGDSAVLEAMIAVPYAYAEAGASGQSLDRYNEAIASFERENGNLDQSIVAIRAGKLLDGLLERNPGEEMGWFWNIGELPEMPHANHLAPLLAQHSFQEAFKNWRDLQFLRSNLLQWQDNLGVFGDMLANRRQAYAERLPKVRAKSAEGGLEALQKRLDEITTELARIEADGDAAALADEKQAALQARVDRIRATLAQAGDLPEAVAARERFRLASGALTWQLAQAYPQNLWDAQKNARATTEALADTRRADAALAQAQQDEPAKFDAFGTRIAELAKAIELLLPRVAALSTEQQQFVQELAVAELVQQKERLVEYTTQARFAVAQLYDRAASQANKQLEPANAPPKP